MSNERNNSSVTVQSIFADDLRDYIESHRERDYLLIDVREPQEYQSGHIPGARLIPLGQIESRLNELDNERELLFYCASGYRSRVAATLVAESGLHPAAVFTVDGGYFAWDGKQLVDFPRVRVFRDLRNGGAVLTAAMNLEKGAWRFYTALADRYPDSPVASWAESLAKLEHQHARVIYRFLKISRGNEGLPSFDDLFEGLPGDILESGDTLEAALAKIETLDVSRCLGFAELALDIEYNAYDLYRTLSQENRDADEKDAFLTLAEQEKGHIRLISTKLKDCFEESPERP